MKVLAKKAKLTFWNYFLPLMALIALILGICYLCVFHVSEKYMLLKWVFGYGGTAVGLFWIAYSISFFIGYRKIPQNIVILEEETISILGKPYSLNAITEVKGYKAGEIGILAFTVNGAKIECRCVHDVNSTAEKIRALLKEYNQEKGQET